MIEGLGEPVKTYDAEEFKVKKKAISPFDFAKRILWWMIGLKNNTMLSL